VEVNYLMKSYLSACLAAILLLLLSIAPALAKEGRDEVESNNTKDLADSVDGFVIHAEIDENDSDDWFVLQGQEGTSPSFTIDFNDDELEVDWEIYSDDDVVATSSEYGAPETLTANVPGTCYIHVWHWSGEGDYTITIETGACAGDSEREPNNDKDLADSIDGLEIQGYACENDHDWYVLGGQEGREPTFTMRFDDEALEVDWEVLSGDDVVASMTDWDSPEHTTVEVPGTCYIHVWWWEGEGDYTIEIEP
jgi:hypothetical protein